MSMRGLIMALIVVLAAVVVFWLTGERAREESGPDSASVPAEAGGGAKARTPARESTAEERPRAREVEVDPNWKQKIRGSENEGDGQPKKTYDSQRETPHAPGSPQI
jgi:hypothetical protein